VKLSFRSDIPRASHRHLSSSTNRVAHSFSCRASQVRMASTLLSHDFGPAAVQLGWHGQVLGKHWLAGAKPSKLTSETPFTIQ